MVIHRAKGTFNVQNKGRIYGFFKEQNFKGETFNVTKIQICILFNRYSYGHTVGLTWRKKVNKCKWNYHVQ